MEIDLQSVQHLISEVIQAGVSVYTSKSVLDQDTTNEPAAATRYRLHAGIEMSVILLGCNIARAMSASSTLGCDAPVLLHKLKYLI